MLALALMQIGAEEAEPLGLDPDTFRAFYEDALPRIYGYFLHRCGGSAPVAEDLTQETFLAAVRELRRGRKVDAPLPWLYGIARHKLLDYYRRREPLLPELREVAAAEEETRERVVAALAAVASTQRAALVLCYLDGFSAAEIGELLGRSTAAVHSLLERGRASFRAAYLEGLA